MRKNHWVSAGLFVGLLALGGAALAEHVSRSPTQVASSDTGSDQAFLARALGVNELELTLGKMAAERGNAPEIRAMGKKMTENHTELGRRLSDLAQQLHGTATPVLSTEQQSTVRRLSSLSGSAFDTSFKSTVDAGHVQELAMYRNAVSQVAAPGLRALAERRVTTLEQTSANSTNVASRAKPEKDEW
jgi:putative membrane protein